MALPSYSQTLSTFVSSTLDEHTKNVIDQIWRATPLMAWAASHRRPQVGGKRVFIPVEYGKNTALIRAVGRGTSLPITQDEIITECWYNWHTYMSGLARYRDDDLENTGKYAVFNKLQAEIDNMVAAFKEGIEEDLFSDESTGANKFCGLQGLIEDVDTAAHDTSQTAGAKTVGNLNRATYTWWGNWGRNMTGKDPSVWMTYFMREQCDNVEAYTGRLPEVIITHAVDRNFYEDEVGETVRTLQVKLGDVGIRAVEYKGIPFLTSTYATQTRMYFIGANTMELIYEPRMWFKKTPWKEPTQQAFDYAQQMLAKGQMTIKKPRGTSVLYNINN